MAGSPPGHLAVLREHAAAGPLSLTLFDGTMSADWNWSQRDEAMAGRILAAPLAATGTLVVAGNAHTRTARTRLGVPLGARLAGQRPGLREIRIRYGGGHFYNIQPRRFRRRPRSGRDPAHPRPGGPRRCRPRGDRRAGLGLLLVGDGVRGAAA